MLLLSGVIISIGATAQSVTLRTQSKQPTWQGKQVIVAAPKDLSSSPSAPSSVSKMPRKESLMKDVLLDEDFSKMTTGTNEQPDDALLGNFYGAPGKWIDGAYTQESGWSGTGIHSAGGCVAVISQADYAAAPLNTPLGDYSGDITITFRARNVPGSKSNALLFVTPCIGGIDYPKYATLDESSSFSYFTLGNNWSEITITFKNYSANNDGFIQFNVYGSALLDDIKITNSASFVAPPIVSSVNHFTADGGFTLNWEPVRKANDYRLYLYKKVYTSDENEVTYDEDFENGAVGEAFTTDGTVVEGEGEGSSKALKLCDGQTLTTVDGLTKIKSADFWLKLVCPEDAIDDIEGITLRSLDESGTWHEAYLNAEAFLDGQSINIDEIYYGGWANTYSQFQISSAGLPEGAYLLVDNYAYTTGRPGKLEQQSLLNGSYAMGLLYGIKGTKLTLTSDMVEDGLDPDAEYYYKLCSHNVQLVSDSKVCHAFGVAAPVALPATDMDASGQYVANWQTTHKATAYQVNTYGVTTAENDETDHEVMAESFDKIDASMTDAEDLNSATPLDNSRETSLSDYASQPGWCGVGNIIARGMLGCESAYEQNNYLVLPPLYLANDSTFTLEIHAYGSPLYYFVVQVGGVAYQTNFDEAGELDESFAGIPVPDDGQDVEVILYDGLSYGAFLVDDVKVLQNVKKGGRVYTYLGTEEVSAPTLSSFTEGLSAYPFEQYAYTVRAKQTLEGATATSDPSDHILVNLAKGESTTGITENAADKKASIVARYNLAGQQIATPAKGLNLVKMSNGKTVKVIVR